MNPFIDIFDDIYIGADWLFYASIIDPDTKLALDLTGYEGRLEFRSSNVDGATLIATATIDPMDSAGVIRATMTDTVTGAIASTVPRVYGQLIITDTAGFTYPWAIGWANVKAMTTSAT